MISPQRPPIWAKRLLRWYCPVHLLEEIEGDLLERFHHCVEEEGLIAARRKYAQEVLRFCNPVTFRKARAYLFTFYPPAHRLAMLRNYFISAIRNLSKNKGYAAINILGLALGVACCVTIFVLVRFETSFDDFHRKADRIYRINIKQKNATGRKRNGYNFYPLGEAIRTDISGLEAVTSMHHSRSFQFTVGDNIYEGKHAFFVDTAYFNVFDGQWLLGNPKNAFRQPNTVVVTDQFAEKYLGGLDKAMDTTFIFDNNLTLKVNGILKAPLHNTDMPYSMLISYPSLPAYVPESTDNWEWVGWGATFIVLNEGTEPVRIEGQLDAMKHRYLSEEDARQTTFVMMPLDDNHDRNYDFNSFTYDFPVPLMLILSIVAGLIAFIACINFINLATAQSLTRAREVGIRKTMGSSRLQLILQYLSEALVLTLVAVVLGLLLAKIPLQLMNAERGYAYLNFSFFQDYTMMAFVVGITLLITLFAGFYPAFVLSGFQPVKALKGKISTGKPKGFNLRRGLVVTQFLGAQMLILVTATMVYQIDHLKKRPIGFDTEAVVFTVLPDTTQDLGTFKQQLIQNPNIQNVAFGWGGPLLNAGSIRFHGEAGEDFAVPGVIHYGDEQYISMFEQTLLAGTNFSADQGNPISEVIVNQALVHALGINRPESFMAVQRTKEIGIRKVLGASVIKIIGLFAKESLLLIVISFVIAAPLGYLLGQALLMELPERVTPGVSVFAATLMASLFIALLTIGYQAFRAANANPADSLRYE